jgi:hypothetical protein
MISKIVVSFMNYETGFPLQVPKLQLNFLEILDLSSQHTIQNDSPQSRLI